MPKRTQIHREQATEPYDEWETGSGFGPDEVEGDSAVDALFAPRRAVASAGSAVRAFRDIRQSVLVRGASDPGDPLSDDTVTLMPSALLGVAVAEPDDLI